MCGAEVVQLECSFPSQCEGSNYKMQDWETKKFREWFIFCFVLSRENPTDATTDFTGGMTGG
jgi:hypothetical protein